MNLPAATKGRASTLPPVLSSDYSDKELTMIKQIWQDTKSVAQQQMLLAVHLYELKTEMDANDPHADNPKKARFWNAFERGDLPEYVCNSKKIAKGWLLAAEFVAKKEFPAAPANSLLALSPTTVCNISKIQSPEAKRIVQEHLKQHQFIGHDAASYLAKPKLNDDVLDEISAWVTDHPERALVPSVIRKVECYVAEQNRPASAKTVTLEPSPEFKEMLKTSEERFKSERSAREIAKGKQAVKDLLNRKSREQAEAIRSNCRRYNDALLSAAQGVEGLWTYIRELNNIKGTEFLVEMRQANGTVFSGSNDIQRVKGMAEKLQVVWQLIHSCNPPAGIDMTTYDVDATE